MKASGVAQGFKWLANKLHPQLPLTSKESQRLLTALNSSFRRHLDEAHPHGLKDDLSKKPSNAVTKGTTSAIHASAHSLADKHLASVLTNPLFVRKPGDPHVLDYASAQTALTKSPETDPIELLEEYHAKGAASIRIAELCLQNFQTRAASLTPEARQTRIEKVQPGRRSFLWLLNSNLYKSDAFTGNLRFIDLLVDYLMLEGREESLWSWLTLNIRKDGQELHVASGRTQVYDQIKWKGRVLKGMISAKMGQMDGDGYFPSDENLNDALDLFAKACDIKRAATSRNDHLSWLPVGPAGDHLELQISWKYSPRTGIDVSRFEKFVNDVPMRKDRAPQIFTDIGVARLELCHPQKPSADRALEVLRQVYSSAPSETIAPILDQMRQPRAKQRQNWFAFANRAIFVLQENGQNDDAIWLRAQTERKFPDLTHFLDRNLTRWQREEGKIKTHEHSRHDDNKPQYRVPFPVLS